MLNIEKRKKKMKKKNCTDTVLDQNEQSKWTTIISLLKDYWWHFVKIYFLWIEAENEHAINIGHQIFKKCTTKTFITINREI